MNKRVEKNKELYRQIDKEIEERKKMFDNSSFTDTKEKLTTINPDLFGNQVISNENNSSLNNHKNKKRYILTAIVFILLLFLIIVLAVI